jgi:hypothetical protein
MSAAISNSNYKTVMCLYWETGCPRQSTCIFAHTAEELRPRMCPHGNHCRFDRRNRHFDNTRRPCGFFHPGERITPDEMFKRATEFSVAKPVAMPGSTPVKTKLCPGWEGACTNKECTMAHTKEELAPEMCKHGARCFFNPKRKDFNPEKKPCHLFHPGDSKDEVFARALHKLKINREKTEKIPQFIVKVSEPAVEEEEYEYEEVEEEAPKLPTFSISAIQSWADDETKLDFSQPLKF